MLHIRNVPYFFGFIFSLKNITIFFYILSLLLNRKK
nr:MAG TPA: hypothetical protein [Caudoviricetes sp.]DAU83667.1 MAG TPA: hypothetical protein [Caudoviricetes sp.]